MLILRAGRAFDGASVSADVDVLVDGSTIVAVEPRSPVPAEAQLVDFGSDATLLPGLIDGHQHLMFDAGPDVMATTIDASDDELVDRARTAARRALQAGITTVRDLGDRNFVTLSLRDEFARNPTAGPRVVASGPPLTTPGGHCWFLGGEAAGVDQLRAAVANHADRGVDVIKIMATGGNITTGSSPAATQFTRPEVEAVVDAAHRAGLPVAVHAHGAAGIAHALDAGADSIEHCTFMTADGVEPDEELIARIGRSGVTVGLTFGIAPGIGTPRPAIAQRLGGLMRVFELIAGSGARLSMGTDAGVGPPKPHDVLPYAIQMLGRWTTHVEALVSATATAARTLGLADRVGRLRAGMTADVLVVRGDPTTDLSALLQIEAAYRDGARVDGAGRLRPGETPGTDAQS